MSHASIRLVDTGWDSEMTTAIQTDPSEVRIICPFIKEGALERLLSYRPRNVKVITRFNLNEFSQGISDIGALRKLLGIGARIRGIRNLHAKLYIFGTSRAIITSANLTMSALTRNQEFGVVADDIAVISTCRDYFDELWRRGRSNLSRSMLNGWAEKITQHHADGEGSNRVTALGDFGQNVGLVAKFSDSFPAVLADAKKAFVKFLGEADAREPVSSDTID